MIRYQNISRLDSILLATCTLASGNVFAESKPFVALINTTESIEFPSATNGLTCPVGSGNGSGKSNLFSKSVSSFTNISLTSTDCVSFGPNGPTSFYQGQFTLVPEPILGQVSSDLITATYQGNLTFNQNGTYTLNGTFSVTGGTGKYKNAQGTGILTGTETIDPVKLVAQGQLQAVGKINY
jgi:hypothetical protein